ncbi:glycosyltransferase family 4 protein [Arthrobacter sp. M4]|uniref:glycosyltransferase family 4 protein n=1 Tax=Arthrobacter sp. M4 TaxID=218160 RepID=UPI001CDC06BC|nr:glycosyltransferase [Arthrobacter sp. M4]MCA4133066.1 glycosyltransferase family 4 protein [Arthrobacter sp. M4]
MRTANIVYWYGLSEMPRDGGGLRALAWHDALMQLGFDVKIHALRAVGEGVQKPGAARKLKKALLPMPLQGELPNMPEADLNVITVPSVFEAASRALPASSMIFDWMDLWSVNARTMGDASIWSRPGGMFQSLVWESRQKRLVLAPSANVFAGYQDTELSEIPGAAPGHWIPTPIKQVPRTVPTSRNRPRAVGFIGNFHYSPNVMSIRRFIDHHSENLAGRGIRIRVAGFGSEIVNTWGKPVEVLGKVDSLVDFYSGIDAAIVPIDHGGGIKAKAVEAMAYGTPVYGTEHVASGFSPDWSAYVAPIEDLLDDNPRPPATPTSEEFSAQFSQEAFMSSVHSLLTATGHLRRQLVG